MALSSSATPSHAAWRQTRALIDEYLQDGWHQRDFLRARCAANPGAALRITDVVTAEVWQRMPMYRRFVRRCGIEWALSTRHVEPILALCGRRFEHTEFWPVSKC